MHTLDVCVCCAFHGLLRLCVCLAIDHSISTFLIKNLQSLSLYDWNSKKYINVRTHTHFMIMINILKSNSLNRFPFAFQLLVLIIREWVREREGGRRVNWEMRLAWLWLDCDVQRYVSFTPHKWNRTPAKVTWICTQCLWWSVCLCSSLSSPSLPLGVCVSVCLCWELSKCS